MHNDKGWLIIISVLWYACSNVILGGIVTVVCGAQCLNVMYTQILRKCVVCPVTMTTTMMVLMWTYIPVTIREGLVQWILYQRSQCERHCIAHTYKLMITPKNQAIYLSVYSEQDMVLMIHYKNTQGQIQDFLRGIWKQRWISEAALQQL